MASSTTEGTTHKRRRTEFSDVDLQRLGLGGAHIEKWRLDGPAVEQLDMHGLLTWVEAVLLVGKHDRDDIRQIIDDFRQQKMTGNALVGISENGLQPLVRWVGPRRTLYNQLVILQLADSGPASSSTQEAVSSESRWKDIALQVRKELLANPVLRSWAGGQRRLVDRDGPQKTISDYVDAVVAEKAAEGNRDDLKSRLKNKESELESTDQKGWKVCATVAASGMGKSAFLETVAQAQHACQKRQALYVTFNTRNAVPLRFRSSAHQPMQYCVSGAFLHAAGATPDHLDKLPGHVQVADVLAYIRTAREMESSDTLVVCVDELLQVPNEHFREEFVGTCMRLQDIATEKVVMLFTAFAARQISSWISISGRGLVPIHLKRLSATTARQALLDEVTNRRNREPTDPQWQNVVNWLTDAAAMKIVSVLATHPRGLFEVFVRYAMRIRYVDSGSMQQLLSSVFEDSDLRHFTDRAEQAVGPIMEMLRGDEWTGTSTHELVQLGMIVKGDGDKWRPISFLVRAVAFAPCGRGPLHDELRAIYTADTGITKQTRVHAQDVVLHFECLLRHAHAKPVGLDSIFRGGIIGKDVLGKTYALRPHGKLPVIHQVPHFRYPERARVHLAAGGILLSSQTNEKGLEYLSPLFDPTSGSLAAVLACQVKGGKSVPKVKGLGVARDAVCPGLLQWALECGKRALPRDVPVIPVLVMVNGDCRQARGPLANKSVQVLGSAVKEWLGLVLPLQMVDEPVDDPRGDYE